MGTAGIVLFTATAALADVVGTLLFAVGAAMTLAAIRLCISHPRAPSILVGFSVLAVLPVVFLWYDGRIARYFEASFWTVVALGFPTGAVATLRNEYGRLVTGAWVGTFAVVFAFRIPLDVQVGSAAVVGFGIEALVVVFTALPVVVGGAAVGSLSRKHLSIDRGD